MEQFNRRYGWIYSTTQLKELKGIDLDKAFDMGIVEALNLLSYLKAKRAYDKELMK